MCRCRHRRETLRPGPRLIGGGVITYTANGAQKVAVASGFTMLAWPTKIVQALRAPRRTTSDVESGARSELR